MSPTAPAPPPLPREPIDRLIAPIERFLHVEAAGGVVLLVCTVVALVIANSPVGPAYHDWWHTEVGLRIGGFELHNSLEHWINDGLMTLFFFVVGLEVKRELVLGDLRDPRAAALPLAAALGGMVVPAAIYVALLGRTPAARGFGVPMATDIAFVVGCMALLGPRVPSRLRVMLLTLAIADDIGAILVIALAYNSDLGVLPLALGLGGIFLVVVFQRLGIRSFGIYGALGAAVWVAFVKSGVHATIAGVLLGLLTPAHAYLGRGKFAEVLEDVRGALHGSGWPPPEQRAAGVRTLQRATRESISPLEYLENLLHPWVSFFIMPVFALANAAVHFQVSDLTQPVAVAVGVGLLLGKPLGIVLFSWLAVTVRVARWPQGVSWAQLAGGGALCGIGFTMALFIATLALDGPSLATAKVGILGGSALAAIAGSVVLYAAQPAK